METWGYSIGTKNPRAVACSPCDAVPRAHWPESDGHVVEPIPGMLA